MTEFLPKILYVGPLGLGSTTLQRMHALQKLSCSIIPFDMNPYYLSGPRILDSIRHRSCWGRAVKSMNTDLSRFAKGVDFDWVWIDKGVWIYASTLEALNRGEKTLLIHYTPDPALLLHKTRHFVRCIPHYDVLITTKAYEIEKYKGCGAKHVIYAGQGFDPDIFKPYELSHEVQKKLTSDVCFIGHFEHHYYRCVKTAAKATDNLAIWGKWGRAMIIHPWLKRIYRGQGIWHVDYAKAICCSKIGLGLLSKLAPEQSTTRTYEIPACGTFMLAERTIEHQELFEEGKEAEFFESNEELLDKIRYYLNHDEQRRAIACAGRERCLKSGYSNQERLKSVLNEIANITGLKTG